MANLPCRRDKWRRAASTVGQDTTRQVNGLAIPGAAGTTWHPDGAQQLPLGGNLPGATRLGDGYEPDGPHPTASRALRLALGARERRLHRVLIEVGRIEIDPRPGDLLGNQRLELGLAPRLFEVDLDLPP